MENILKYSQGCEDLSALQKLIQTTFHAMTNYIFLTNKSNGREKTREDHGQCLPAVHLLCRQGGQTD